MSRRHGRRLESESSAGRLDHPPHSMWVVEACSAAAARGTAFVRPHCRPRVTEVHSAAACAAPAQSPSAALIGYDGTALFHHAAYAASYAARSTTWQATPLDYAWCRSDKTAPGHAERGIPGAGKKSRNEIPFACDAIMYELYVILYYSVWGHLSGTHPFARCIHSSTLRRTLDSAPSSSRLKQYNTQWT